MTYGSVGYIMTNSHIAEGKLMDTELLNEWGGKKHRDSGIQFSITDLTLYVHTGNF